MKFIIGRIKMFLTALLVVFLMVTAQPILMANTYTETLKKDLWHGAKNLLTAPLEIPVAIQDAHERAGWPFVRQCWGVFEGGFKTINRANAGLWEMMTALLPGPQGKITIQPENLI